MHPVRTIQIQRFQVQSRLGSGAMGNVYRAHDPELARDVAIKVLARPASRVTDELSSHDTLDLRGDAPAGELLAEARMMARLSHPNVLPVYEIGMAEGELFVVMEHIAGADLRKWLARQRTTREIVEVFTQAARGLAAAHEQGIVHRDFKPENVLVGDDGRVRVADFGLSRLTANRGPVLRVEQQVGGTPYYMAPELWRAEPATDHSDVFALCTALAEAFDNRPDERDQLDRILRERGVGKELRALIAAGLADEPDRRPKASEIADALAARPARRTVWVLAGLGAAGVAAIAIVLAVQGGTPACAAKSARLALTWDEARRAAVEKIEKADVTGYVMKQRAAMDRDLRAVCVAEERGTITAAQASIRISCLQRRAIEAEVIVQQLVTFGEAKLESLAAAVEDSPDVAECERLTAPPLPPDHAPVMELFRRLVATFGMTFASPERTEALAAIERDAKALGERELEARAALLLGMRQIETDQLTAADASLSRSYDTATAIQASGIALLALIKRAVAADLRGEPLVAHTYARLATELADKEGTPVWSRVTAYSAAGRSEYIRGQPAVAVQYLEKALALLKQTPIPRLEINVRFAMIAALHDLPGRNAQALELAKDTLELARKVLGEKHVDYGTALNVVAIAYRCVNDRENALDYRRRALAVMASVLPPDHSVVLGQRMNVANDLFANGRFEEARTEASEVIRLREDSEARYSWPDSVADLGAHTFATGRLEEGVRLFQEGLEGMISQNGQEHPETLLYRLQRVDFDLELGRLDDAEQRLDALERSYRARKDQALGIAIVDGIYRAHIALARGRPRDAESRARAGLAAMPELHGDETDREELLYVLGASLVDQEQWRMALDALAQSAAVATANHQLEDRFARIDIKKARALAGLGRRDEADALLRRARAVLDRFPGDVLARKEADELLRPPQPPGDRAQRKGAGQGRHRRRR